MPPTTPSAEATHIDRHCRESTVSCRLLPWGLEDGNFCCTLDVSSGLQWLRSQMETSKIPFVLTAVADDLSSFYLPRSSWKRFSTASLFQHYWQRHPVHTHSKTAINTSRTGGASAVVTTATSAMGWLKSCPNVTFCSVAGSLATPETLPSDRSLTTPSRSPRGPDRQTTLPSGGITAGLHVDGATLPATRKNDAVGEGFDGGAWRTVISALSTPVLASNDNISIGGKTARYRTVTVVTEDLSSFCSPHGLAGSRSRTRPLPALLAT